MTREKVEHKVTDKYGWTLEIVNDLVALEVELKPADRWKEVKRRCRMLGPNDPHWQDGPEGSQSVDDICWLVEAINNELLRDNSEYWFDSSKGLRNDITCTCPGCVGVPANTKRKS